MEDTSNVVEDKPVEEQTGANEAVQTTDNMNETPQQPMATEPVPQTPIQQQGYQPQMQPQMQPQVQYIVNQKDLNGLGGWLMFYLILFVLFGLAYITAFFSAISAMTTPTMVVTAIFSPLIAVGSIASVVLIAMRKKLAVLVGAATFGVSGLYAAVNVIVSAKSETPIAVTVGGTLTSLVIFGLFALYFFVSKRVKQTLVN